MDFFAQPLVGALLATWLLNQPFTLNLWIGSICIIAGVLLATYPVGRLLRWRGGERLRAAATKPANGHRCR